MCVLELLVFYLVIRETCAWIQQVKWLSLLGSRLLLHLQILQGRQFLVHCHFGNDLPFVMTGKLGMSCNLKKRLLESAGHRPVWASSR